MLYTVASFDHINLRFNLTIYHLSNQNALKMMHYSHCIISGCSGLSSPSPQGILTHFSGLLLVKSSSSLKLSLIVISSQKKKSVTLGHRGIWTAAQTREAEQPLPEIYFIKFPGY